MGDFWESCQWLPGEEMTRCESFNSIIIIREWNERSTIEASFNLGQEGGKFFIRQFYIT